MIKMFAKLPFHFFFFSSSFISSQFLFSSRIFVFLSLFNNRVYMVAWLCIYVCKFRWMTFNNYVYSCILTSKNIYLCN